MWIIKLNAAGNEDWQTNIGRTKKTIKERQKSGKDDGRKREEKDVVDTFNPENPGEGSYKEQKHIDKEGGIENLNNKRNEVSNKRMKDLERKHG